jgi:transcriptional regulator with XRE-family HTH domain
VGTLDHLESGQQVQTWLVICDRCATHSQTVAQRVTMRQALDTFAQRYAQSVTVAQLDEILAEALARSDGNMSTLGRATGYSASSVGRWFSGHNKPDLAAALRLAEITGRSAREVVEAAGHDPNLLRVVRESDVPQRPPLLMRLRSFEAELQRWMSVMGPRVGPEEAERLFWDRRIENARRETSDAEALLGAANSGIPSADNSRDKTPRRKLSGGGPNSGGSITPTQHLVRTAAAA